MSFYVVVFFVFFGLCALQVDARNIDGSTPLCDACAAGSLDCVKLLLEYGATVNPPLFTFSPLHEACMGGVSCYILQHTGMYSAPCICTSRCVCFVGQALPDLIPHSVCNVFVIVLVKQYT